MKPEFSEFSYGYAITEEIISSILVGLKAAPVFPNLRQEGQEGGGYDVQLNYTGYPIFLQFKISDYITRANSKAKEKGIFKPVFYRMPIHSKRQSKQHQLLIELENKYEAVYYVAPAFHLLTQLDSYYLKNQVCQNSIFVRPQKIGDLPDNKGHHISFKSPNNEIYFCSEPRLIGRKLNFPTFGIELSRLIPRQTQSAIFSSREFLEELLNSMLGILSDIIPEGSPFITSINSDLISYRRDSNPLQMIAYLARTYFNCETIVVYREQR